MNFSEVPATQISDLAVRVARSDSDFAGLQTVARATWPATYAGLLADATIATFLDHANSLSNLAYTSTSLGDGLLIAERRGGVIGYAMAGPNREDEAELFALYVRPDEQAHGIGFALWNAAMAHLRSLDHDVAMLWVLTANAGARRFYERQGAVASDSRIITIGNEGVSEIRYRVKLQSVAETGGSQ